jgi:hypothetical protein
VPSERSAVLPLDGVRVVDLTRNVAGPYCTMMLGDMGAEVIKVEPPSGDELRRLFRLPGRDEDTEDVFAIFNRNKRSMVVDLKTDHGRETLSALLGRSDVFIHNMAPGAVDRLGFSWDVVHAISYTWRSQDLDRMTNAERMTALHRRRAASWTSRAWLMDRRSCAAYQSQICPPHFSPPSLPSMP